MGDTSTGGRYRGRERVMAYILGNASGLGLAVGAMFVVYGSTILAGISAVMVVGTFYMFRVYPWRFLHTDSDQ